MPFISEIILWTDVVFLEGWRGLLITGTQAAAQAKQQQQKKTVAK